MDAARSSERLGHLAQQPNLSVLKWEHNVGMSEDKKFCPNCKAMTMEPAEGTLITPEQLSQMEPGPPVFEGRLTPYQCPVCLHFAYQPEF